MRNGLGAYSEHQDAKPSWHGLIPPHWAVMPNRALFAEVKERDHPGEDMLSVTISRGVVQQRVLLDGTSKKDSSNTDRSAYKLVVPGDIAYNKMRAWQGAIGASSLRGIVSPAYVVMRLRDRSSLPAYFHYLYRTPQFAKEAERWSYGITSDMWSLRPEHFKMIYTPVPPVEEQAAIVRYLDWACGRLDRAIRAKRKIIALLNEQKQTMIDRAVTHGLRSYSARKHSGFDWLGDIPAHWRVLALRRSCHIVDCKHLTVPFHDEGVPLASVRQVQKFELDLAGAKKTSAHWIAHLVDRGREPKIGDLIYCRNVSVGACSIVTTEDEFAMGQDVCLIRPADEKSRYVNYFLHSGVMQRQLALLLVGSTFKRINVAQVKSLFIALPPRDEQDIIVADLDARMASFRSPLSSVEREASLIREYRTRLIADVVTGKLDVREAAANLPAEEPLGAAAADDGEVDEINEDTGEEQPEPVA